MSWEDMLKAPFDVQAERESIATSTKNELIEWAKKNIDDKLRHQISVQDYRPIKFNFTGEEEKELIRFSQSLGIDEMEAVLSKEYNTKVSSGWTHKGHYLEFEKPKGMG